ncbi:hypothetical protein EDC01DRAFT_752811 [Geopyxis carbonaria]|nr:hypothetical protein EDC01DRAFT_752811 [Geopyxis carbonaria]
MVSKRFVVAVMLMTTTATNCEPTKATARVTVSSTSPSTWPPSPMFSSANRKENSGSDPIEHINFIDEIDSAHPRKTHNRVNTLPAPTPPTLPTSRIVDDTSLIAAHAWAATLVPFAYPSELALLNGWITFQLVEWMTRPAVPPAPAPATAGSRDLEELSLNATNTECERGSCGLSSVEEELLPGLLVPREEPVVIETLAEEEDLIVFDDEEDLIVFSDDEGQTSSSMLS